MVRSPDDDGSGGAPPPPPAQHAPIPRPQEQAQSAPAHRPDTTADLRAEAAQYRINARQHREDAERARQEAADALARLDSEREKATKPLTAKIERLQQRMIDATLTSRMVAAGLQDPDLVGLAARMPNAPKLVLNDDDEVVGVEEMIRAFKEWKPDFFRKPQDPRSSTSPSPTPSPPKVTGGGSEPPPASSGPVTNVRSMDKASYAKWKSDQLSILRRADRR